MSFVRGLEYFCRSAGTDISEPTPSMELTPEIIKRRSGHYDVSLVALLDVSGMKLRRIASLESCVNLLELNLAHNELRSLEELPTLPLLRCLHLSNNELTSLATLPLLPSLEELSVAKNQIRSVDFVELATKLPSLRVLNFDGNPLDIKAGAKASKAFPNLFILNGKTLTLTRLLEEITINAVSKSAATEDENPVEAGLELDDEAVESNDDAVGVNEFINESTRHLEELLQQCKQTLAIAEPALISPLQ
ncbi:Leucine-rich repeat [Phytophthora infestans]|uniref:Leucine-rich repeat n=1 Tax=Phytophthora infestans TaxID=4787 RepID=A0A8S9URR2_PHYIN|nr:Leucine-rich repeat [Phytophthora infestans]